MEGIVLKQLLIGAVCVALGTGSLNAQDVDLRKVDVPGADFDIVFAVSADRHDHPMVIHSIGGELAHAVDGEIEKMFTQAGPSGLPIHAFRVELGGGTSSKGLNVYVVPKRGQPAH